MSLPSFRNDTAEDLQKSCGLPDHQHNRKAWPAYLAGSGK